MRKSLYGVVVLIVGILSGCYFPGYNADTADLTRRADNNSDYLDVIKTEYNIEIVYMEEPYYFDDLIFFEDTDIFEDVTYSKTGFDVIMGITAIGEEIILYVPEFEEFAIHEMSYPFPTPEEVTSVIDEWNQNNLNQITQYNPSSGYPLAGFNSTNRLNDETQDVLEKEPVVPMMLGIGTYTSTTIGSCEVYLIQTDANEFTIVANSSIGRSTGYLVLHTFSGTD
jgi:hypothetical protein